MSSPPPLPAAAPLAASPATPLADFGDWLSPMIVKELRQGLRTWIFVGAFIVLQAILVMTLLISLSAGNQESSSWLFWMIIAGILVFIVPLRGFNALSGEMKSETLDLLMLTRLDSFRIAVGKWAALVAQSALIAISVLPYVVLRYFGGGVDLTLEFFVIALLWLLSAAVTAVAVAFSALPSVIVRTLVLLGTWFWSAMVCASLIAEAVEGSRSGGSFGPFSISTTGSPGFGWFLAVLLPLWAFGCYYVLDLGASAIAPLAANHATRKRLIALAMMLVALGCVLELPPHHDGRKAAMACLVIIAVLASLDCLTETPTASPSVYAPFMRFGALGKFAAFFVSPGWATGLLYYGVVAALVSMGLAAVSAIDDKHERLAYFNALLTPITPLAIALTTFRRAPRLLGPYIVCTLIIVITSCLFMFMTSLTDHDGAAYVGMATPPSALMLSAAVSEYRNPGLPIYLLTGGALAGIVFLLYLIYRAITPFRAMLQAMNLAAATTKPAASREGSSDESSRIPPQV